MDIPRGMAFGKEGIEILLQGYSAMLLFEMSFCKKLPSHSAQFPKNMMCLKRWGRFLQNDRLKGVAK